MSVNLIFKIAAVGILVSILCQVLKHSGRTGMLDQSGRTFTGFILDCAIYL